MGDRSTEASVGGAVMIDVDVGHVGRGLRKGIDAGLVDRHPVRPGRR